MTHPPSLREFATKYLGVIDETMAGLQGPGDFGIIEYGGVHEGLKLLICLDSNCQNVTFSIGHHIEEKEDTILFKGANLSLIVEPFHSDHFSHDGEKCCLKYVGGNLLPPDDAAKIVYDRQGKLQNIYKMLTIFLEKTKTLPIPKAQTFHDLAHDLTLPEDIPKILDFYKGNSRNLYDLSGLFKGLMLGIYLDSDSKNIHIGLGNGLLERKKGFRFYQSSIELIVQPTKESHFKTGSEECRIQYIGGTKISPYEAAKLVYTQDGKCQNLGQIAGKFISEYLNTSPENSPFSPDL